MRTVLQDLRYAFRQLIKMPGFTFTAVISARPRHRRHHRRLQRGLCDHHGSLSLRRARPHDSHALHRSPTATCAASESPARSGRSCANPLSLKTPFWKTTGTSPSPAAICLKTCRASISPPMASTSSAFPPALGRGLQPSDAIDGQDPTARRRPRLQILAAPLQLRSQASSARPSSWSAKTTPSSASPVRASPGATAMSTFPLKVTGDPVKAFYAGIRLKPGITHAQADAALAPLIQPVRQGNSEALSRPDHCKFTSCGLNEDFIEQLGGTLVSALRRRRPASPHRMRQCLHSASRPRHRPPA